MNIKSPSAVDEALREMSSRELGKLKVFIVEDDQLISELVVTKLTQKGCIPFTTPDGNEALALARQYMPDAIILDLMLPGMTGEEILRELKQDEFLKDIPVIIFTNKSEDTDKRKMMELGAARFLVKVSTDLNDLVDELNALTLN